MYCVLIDIFQNDIKIKLKTMKKNLLLLLVCLVCVFAHAENGRLNITPEGKLPLDKALDYVVDQYNLDGSFSFKEVRNYTDDLGIKHISYQQYYNSIAVENGMVMFHAKKDNVYYINGTLMTNEETPNVSINATRSVDAKPTVWLKHSNEYVECYKRNDFKNHKILFICKESGDTIKTLSTEYNLTGKGLTMYSGMQEMEVKLMPNNFYSLIDSTRKIFTCNTSNVEVFNLGHITDYYKLSEGYFSPTPTFYGIITGVAITNVSGSWWGNSIIDSEPDLYIVIKDSKGRELYRSNVVDDKNTATWNFANKFVHIDDGSTIEIYDEDVDSDDYGGAVKISSTEPGLYTWSGEKTSGAIRIKANPAVDAHWGMQKVLDFYKEKLNRNGFNNLGTTTYLFVDPYALVGGTHEYNNASAACDNDGVGYMKFGLGDGILCKPFVALDIMAHEFTHNVIKFNGNGGLDYKNESGALNESFADIMGTAIDFYAKGDKANWVIGEDFMVMHDQARSMSNPKIGMSFNKNKLADYLGYDSFEDIPDETLTKFKDNMISRGFQPDTYKGEYWEPSTDTPNDTNDYGGVHTNSGVQNYWFYLLSEGGSGVNDNGDSYEVSGIGIESAYKIAYRNLTTYLLKDASFKDAMEGSLKATIDLFGKDTKEYEAVQNAWYAVGVADKDNGVKQVSADEIKFTAYSTNGQIIVNASEGAEISLFNIKGSMISHLINNDETVSLDPMGENVVVVKVDNQSKKVIVKK